LLEAASFPGNFAFHFLFCKTFLTFVFHIMLDPDPNPVLKPEPECISGSAEAKSCGSVQHWELCKNHLYTKHQNHPEASTVSCKQSLKSFSHAPEFFDPRMPPSAFTFQLHP
jgi:hypothetical protein